jgi:hypothetical protein
MALDADALAAQRAGAQGLAEMIQHPRGRNRQARRARLELHLNRQGRARLVGFHDRGVGQVSRKRWMQAASLARQRAAGIAHRRRHGGQHLATRRMQAEHRQSG